MPVVTTIKLTGENHEDVDTVCTQIKRISDESGIGILRTCLSAVSSLAVLVTNSSSRLWILISQ